MIVEIAVKYWLTALFALIAGGLGFVAKHYYNLWKKDKQAAKEKEFKDFENNLKSYVDDKINDMKKSHNNLFKAVLDVQQKQFQKDCYSFLNQKHKITIEEFNNLYRNYEIYRSLGGNGIGSMLFEKVEEKYSMQLVSNEIFDEAAARKYLPPQEPEEVVYIPHMKPPIRPPHPPEGEGHG